MKYTLLPLIGTLVPLLAFGHGTLAFEDAVVVYLSIISVILLQHAHGVYE